VSTTFFTASPEQSLRARTKALWESGDFGIVAPYLEPTAAAFAARLPQRHGRRLLDVACGTGNLARAAARAGWMSTGVDLAANLIQQARLKSARENLAIGFLEADAELLPFPAASFDCVASCFGIMFAPRPESALLELLRVCRSGGCLALAHWTPMGLVGEYLGALFKHSPATANRRLSTDWGDAAHLQIHLGPDLQEIHSETRTARIHFPFPPHLVVDFFGQFHGPTLRTLVALDIEAREALRHELESLLRRHNQATDGTTLVEAEYLDFQATRR
jgi:SAM-dependent methyltransferase